MKINSRWIVVFVFAFGFLVCQPVKAASITGKVVGVTDGDEITIYNLNRNARIKLIAIDAPEKDQAFGAAAKQHLFDLVYDKLVTVEYQGVGADGSLVGRVWSGGNDICAQMIRDGAAWYVAADQSLLTEEQREIYYQSEQAARAEKRGLWQSGDAIAPWEFVKAEELKKATTPNSTKAVSANGSPTRTKTTAELNSMGLLRTGSAEPVSIPAWADGSLPRTWQRFQPTGESFSAILPDGGHQESVAISFGEQTVLFSVYLVKEGESQYALFWAKFPNNRPGSDLLDEFFEGYINKRNERLTEKNPNGRCEVSATRNISARGYLGREYDLSKCDTPDVLRVYTKEIGSQQIIYLASVRFTKSNENVSRFLKSFTVGARNVEEAKTKSTQ